MVAAYAASWNHRGQPRGMSPGAVQGAWVAEGRMHRAPGTGLAGLAWPLIGLWAEMSHTVAQHCQSDSASQKHASLQGKRAGGLPLRGAPGYPSPASSSKGHCREWGRRAGPGGWGGTDLPAGVLLLMEQRFMSMLCKYQVGGVFIISLNTSHFGGGSFLLPTLPILVPQGPAPSPPPGDQSLLELGGCAGFRHNKRKVSPETEGATWARGPGVGGAEV